MDGKVGERSLIQRQELKMIGLPKLNYQAKSKRISSQLQQTPR